MLEAGENSAIKTQMDLGALSLSPRLAGEVLDARSPEAISCSLEPPQSRMSTPFWFSASGNPTSHKSARMVYVRLSILNGGGGGPELADSERSLKGREKREAQMGPCLGQEPPDWEKQ